MNFKNFTSASKKALVARLELYYAHKLFGYDRWKKEILPRMRKTSASRVDRRFRIELKSLEIILENLDSQLFKNEQKSSIRQTMQIKQKFAVPRKN